MDDLTAKNMSNTTQEYIKALYAIGQVGPNQKYSIVNGDIQDNNTYIGWLYTAYNRSAAGETREDLYAYLCSLLHNAKIDFMKGVEHKDINNLEYIYRAINAGIVGIRNMVNTVYNTGSLNEEFKNILDQYKILNTQLYEHIQILKNGKLIIDVSLNDDDIPFKNLEIKDIQSLEAINDNDDSFSNEDDSFSNEDDSFSNDDGDININDDNNIGTDQTFVPTELLEVVIDSGNEFQSADFENKMLMRQKLRDIFGAKYSKNNDLPIKTIHYSEDTKVNIRDTSFDIDINADSKFLKNESYQYTTSSIETPPGLGGFKIHENQPLKMEMTEDKSDINITDVLDKLSNTDDDKSKNENKDSIISSLLQKIHSDVSVKKRNPNINNANVKVEQRSKRCIQTNNTSNNTERITPNPNMSKYISEQGFMGKIPIINGTTENDLSEKFENVSGRSSVNPKKSTLM